MVEVGDLRLLLLANKQNKRCRKPIEVWVCRTARRGEEEVLRVTKEKKEEAHVKLNW